MTTSPDNQPLPDRLASRREINNQEEIKVAQITEVLATLLTPGYSITNQNDPHLWLFQQLTPIISENKDRWKLYNIFQEFLDRLKEFNLEDLVSNKSNYCKFKSNQFHQKLSSILISASSDNMVGHIDSTRYLFNAITRFKKMLPALDSQLKISSTQSEKIEVGFLNLTNQVFAEYFYSNFIDKMPDLSSDEKLQIHNRIYVNEENGYWSRADIIAVERDTENTNRIVMYAADGSRGFFYFETPNPLTE
ncbi:MAG: hypothetical protein OHK0017_00200 [Patescibacteria group bacterium]